MTVSPAISLKRFALLSTLMFALSACTASFRSDVTTFHELSAIGGKTVSIVPMNPDKQDSLEFKQYAGLIANELMQQGYKVSDGAQPELVVGFDVVISDGREKIENRPSIRSSWHAGWGRQWAFWGGWGRPYDPFHDRFHNELVAKTVYHTELSVEIREFEGEKIFEGRAETDARSNALPKVMPNLTQALFTGFPGASGETRHIRIELNKE